LVDLEKYVVKRNSKQDLKKVKTASGAGRSKEKLRSDKEPRKTAKRVG